MLHCACKQDARGVQRQSILDVTHTLRSEHVDVRAWKRRDVETSARFGDACAARTDTAKGAFRFLATRLHYPYKTPMKEKDSPWNADDSQIRVHISNLSCFAKVITGIA